MKNTFKLITAAAIYCIAMASCGESNDPNVNGSVLPDTTNIDTLNKMAPADGMGPNTAPMDSNVAPTDSMKGTRGNSDTSKPKQ